MKKLLEVILPQPPSVNHYTKASRYGGRYLSKDAVAFKQDARRIIAVHAPQEPSKNRLVVKVIFGFKDDRRRDLDNFLKVTLDSLQGIVFADDSQIDVLLAKRGNKVAGGQVTVKIWERDDQHDEKLRGLTRRSR